jgi:hypothetical protein
MEKYHIKLTDDEAANLAKIDLESSNSDYERARKAYESNKIPILSLLHSLNERDAIPRERLNYWSDPRYNQGRIKASRKGVFERNGTKGADIYTHPNFVPYLRYFLFGVDLPDEVIENFEIKVGNPQWITSSDIVPLGKFARSLTRQHGLDTSYAPEEFLKLCLDIGLGLNTAERVMRSVKQVR